MRIAGATLIALYLVAEVIVLHKITKTEWFNAGRAYRYSDPPTPSHHLIWLAGFFPFYTVLPMLIIGSAFGVIA